MARYTIDVYTLLKDNNFKVFNFDYDFYTDDPNIKQAFETKFIDRYMFNEIGFETVARFKHYLKERLNSIAPYYKQLYETELKSKDIQFLLNKDLKETFIRELEGENKSQNDNTSSSTSSVTTQTNESNNSTVNLKSNESNENTVNDSKTESLNSNFKESNLDNGNADLGLNSGNLTSVSNKSDSNSSNNEITSTETKDNTVSSTNKNSIENNSNTSNSIEGTNNTTINNKNNETETTTLISQGNIGVTSSAELLKQWREVLINIDNLIIEECRDLFMTIY